MKTKENEYCGKHYGLLEYVIGFIIGSFAGFLVSEIIYGILLVNIVVAVVVGCFASKIYVNRLITRRMRQFSIQFCDYLDSVGSSLSCGRNSYEAFLFAYEDMIDLYKPDTPICIEAAKLSDGLKSGRSVEELLIEMSKRSQDENVKIFADVYSICNVAGGNLKRIINETKATIVEKAEIEAEIRTVLAEPQNELNIMSVMPLAITTALKTLGSSYAGQTSYLVNTIALLVFGFSYVWGRRIVCIRV